MAGSGEPSNISRLPSTKDLGAILPNDLQAGSQETPRESYYLSSEMIDSHGATLNGSQSAQGEHTSHGVDRNRPRVKRSIPNTGGKGGNDKRLRRKNWEDYEKSLLLVGRMEDILQRVKHKLGLDEKKPTESWFHNVSEQYLPDRGAESCQSQWDTLLKCRNAIFDHESKISSGKSKHPSFWRMTKEKKDIVNQERRSAQLSNLLPREFPEDWYALIGMIQIQDSHGKKNQDSRKEIESIQGDVNPRSSSAPSTSTQLTDHTAISSQVHSHGPNDDLLISRLRIMIEGQIKLLTSDIQGRREDEQKHRDKILAIEKEKLELKTRKLEILAKSSIGGPGFPSSQALEVPYNAGSAASAQPYYGYVQNLPPSRVSNQLLTVNADPALCYLRGAQAGVGAHLGFQTNYLPLVPFGNFHAGRQSEAILATANPAGQLYTGCFNHSAQAGTMPYSNVHPSLGHDRDVPIGSAIHQPINIAPDDLDASGDTQAGQFAERCLVDAEQMCDRIMVPPDQVQVIQNSSTFLGYHGQTQPEN